MKEGQNAVDPNDSNKKIYQELQKKHSSKSATKSTVSIMDKKNMFSLLVFLKYNRPAIKSDIYTKISRNSSMNDKLTDLEGLGLITMYSSEESAAIYVVLTDKGERVAKMFEDLIEEIEKPDEFKVPERYNYWREKKRD